MDGLSQRLTDTLAQRRGEGLYRRRLNLESAQGTQVVVDGRPMLGFCSNDYLGLANHPEVVAEFQRAAGEYGVGSGASHLVVGHSRVHHQLEERLAAWTGRERALLFSSGYMANLGVLTALLGKGDSVFEDRLNHASLLDGGMFSGARFKRFLHNDLESLEGHLNRGPETGLKLVVVDGVFSMDGDLAPLPDIAASAARHGACLMVDDAHGMGVLGSSGAGSVQHFGLSETEVPILMGTLGKGLGTSGAFVAGSESLIETLIQLSRTYIYTTALPPAIAAATLKSVDLAQREYWRREHLQELIQQFRLGCQGLGLSVPPSSSAIQPIIIGSAEEAMRWSDELAKRGLLVGAIRPPTVPRGSSRLRVTLSAAHTPTQVDRLLDELAKLAN
ncbi:MAG: 8-amino-7-oxononanoate synthase [Halieaceae bacterium]|jgi:8-amino-7-oxononanoate synthase